MNNFEIQPRGRYDKSATVVGPHGLCLSVDYDDVDPIVIDELVAALLVVLNRPNIEVWNDAEEIGRDKSEAYHAKEADDWIERERLR